MQAVIMAGGEGTRLRPLTITQPKPLLPIVNKPMMEHVVDLLRRHGITEIIVTVGFLADSIRRHFGDGEEFGVSITYVNEATPLGTAGSVGNVRSRISGPFVAISGDVITDIDITELIGAHIESDSIATIAIKSMNNPTDFGIVLRDENDFITQFLEKPNWGDVLSDTASTGIYVLEPEIFDFIEPGVARDFSEDVFPNLLENKIPLKAHQILRYWEDVGTNEGYMRAHVDALQGSVELEIPGFALDNGVWIGDGCEVHPEAHVEGPAFIGAGSYVGKGARLSSFTVLGSNVRVGKNVDMKRAIVHDNVYVGDSAHLRGCVLGRSVDVRAGVRVETGVVVGDECYLGDNSVLTSDVKIYPRKAIDQGAVVNSSIVWESRATRSLFSEGNVVGLANVDITPELATRVALAFGSTFKRGSSVSITRDSSRAARSIARSITSALNATGLDVYDLENSPIPIARYVTRIHNTIGGVCVRLSKTNPEIIVISFFNAEGNDIEDSDRRRLERIYHREDFRRVPSNEIGDLRTMPRSVEQYTDALLATCSLRDMRERAFKLILDYSYGSTSVAMPNILSKLNVEVLAMNPYTATKKAISFDLDEHAKNVSAVVKSSGADVGVIFGPLGEKITLVDDTGHVLTDRELVLSFTQLVGQTATIERRVVAPINSSLSMQRVCDRYGLSLNWSKLSVEDVVKRVSDPNAVLGLGPSGGVIFPKFLPILDGIAAFVHLLSMLALTKVNLSEVVQMFPNVFVATENVPTPWDRRGQLMRSLISLPTDDRIVLVDGIKWMGADEWTLVIPDSNKPVTNIWAEAPTMDRAKQLCEEAKKTIESVLHK